MPWWPQELPPAHTVRIKITQTLVSVTRRRCRCPSISSVDKDGGVGTQVDIVRHLPTLQVVEVKVVHALGKLFLGTLHLGNDLKDSPAEVQRLLVKGVKVVLRHWPKSVALVKGITVVLQLRLEAALVKCTKAVLWLWLKNVTSLACWRVSTCCVCVWSLTELTWVWIDSLTQFSELTWVQIYSLIELHTHTHAHTLYYKLFLIVPTHTHTLYYEHTHTHTPKQKQKQQTQEAYESQNVTSCEFQVICACRTKRPKTMANVIAAKIDIKMALKEYNSISGTFSFKNWTSHKIK